MEKLWFDESLSLNEQIEQYAVTGGVPKYIELFERKKDIYSSIKDNILSTSAFLYAEPEFLLQKEVSEIGSYFSVLKTIAAENHKLGKIASALGVSQSNLTPYLKTLIDLDIIEREVPITEENPVSYVYEDVCREDIWNLLSDCISFNRVGRWWGAKDVEIDIVAYDSCGKDIVFGECKYSTQKKGLKTLKELQENANAVNWNKDSRTEYFAIYSKSGFTNDLVEYAKQHDNIFLKDL